MQVFNAIRKHAIALITLLVIIALGVVYLFVYIPHNETMIREQRFHVLQDIDKNVHAKIENSTALLDNILKAYKTAGSTNDSVLIDKYVNDTAGKNFSFIPLKIIDTIDTDSLDRTYTLTINDKTEEVTLSYSKLFKKELRKRNSVYQVGMKFTFDQFMRALLPQNVFDEYVIFSKGNTVYETFPAGISYVKDDSLMGLNKGMSRSSLHDFNISGKDYKVFLQPVHFNLETEWVIGGLLSDKRFEAEKKHLPFPIILLLITLALCLLISAPWIKLFHMGGKDRLTVADGAFTILVSMLLVSIIFLCFFKYNLPFRTDNSPDSKSILANSIINAFKKEIDSVYLKLHKYDENLKSDYNNIGKDIVYNKEDGKFHYFRGKPEALADSDKNFLTGLSTDRSINHLSWINRKGIESFRWSKDSVIPPHSKLTARNYFKNTIEGRPYNLKSPYDGTIHSFYLDQVISWTNGNFVTVLSIPSAAKDTISVATATIKVTSLANTILPVGYQFAIIDKQGTVLYHSDSSHNLNENMRDKFSAKNELQSSLNSHTSNIFQTDYLSKSYSVKVQPIGELPYFIVILSDTAYTQTRDLLIYSFTFTMLVLFIFFLLFEMLVIFFASAKRSFLKKQLFDTAWIGPKQSMHFEYLISSFFNIVTIVALLLCFSLPSFLSYGFILLFSISFLTLFLHFLYYCRYVKKSKLDDPQRQLINTNYNPLKARFKIRAMIIIISWIVIINLAAIKLLDPSNFQVLILFQFCAIAVSIGIYFLGELIRSALANHKIKFIQKISAPMAQTLAGIKESASTVVATDDINKIVDEAIEKQSLQQDDKRNFLSGVINVFKDKYYIRSFTFMVVTRLIITSGIPVVFFYISSYNYEQRVIIKYKESVFADQLAEKLPNNNAQIGSFLREHPSVYVDSAWVRSVDAANNPDEIRNYSKEQTAAISVLNGFRPDVTDEAIREERFNMQFSSDGEYYFDVLLDSNKKEIGTILYRPANAGGKFIKLTSEGLGYNPPKLFHAKGWMFWILMIITLTAFFFLLQKIIKKLFAVKTPDISKWSLLDDNILRDNLVNQRIFVLGAPGVKKRRQIRELLDKGTIKTMGLKNGEKLYDISKGRNSEAKFYYYIADMINIPDGSEDKRGIEEWEKCRNNITDDVKLVVVSHFEYNIENAYANNQKLNFLESLMLQDIEKIIILSTIHPLAFFDSLFVGKKKKDKSENDAETLIPKSDVERWNVLLGHYAIVFMPLGSFSSYTQDRIGVDTEKENEDQLESYIDKEIKDARFLDKLKDATYKAALTLQETSKIEEKDFNAEEVAFKLQLTSHYFYMYIWQSLTKEEKFILYDLAEDNLVNSYDSHNLALLMGKRLIYRDSDGTLRLFNKGFRNFILTAIGNTEAMKIKERIKDNGSWSKWRTPLILIFIAILVFLMASQQEVYSELFTYLTAFGAVIPLFLKLLSLFDKSGQKGE